MDSALHRGIQLFNSREYFECHEVLEDAWMSETGPRKLFLQSIIHFAVAYYHLGRDNRVGAIRQMRKAIRKLQPYAPVYEGVDTDALLRNGWATLESVRRGDPVQYPLIGLCGT